MKVKIYQRILILILTLTVMVTLAFLLVSHVSAQSSTTPAVNATTETDAIRDLLDQAMRAYRLGDYQNAFKLSRSAYLDHFENIEIQLRTLDPDLTSEMEFRFADLRTKMQAGAPAADVEQAAQSVRDGLNQIDPMFSGTGIMAPALAFTSSFTIIFREGLEATLVIAALLGYLQSGAGRRGRRHVFVGIGLAILCTVITWVILRFVISIAPVGREVIEAVVSFVAVGMLFWVSFWLVSRLDRQHWMEFLRAKSWAAMASGSALGLIGVGFTAIYREGFETALFYEALLGMSRQIEGFVLVGFLAGCAVLAVVAWMILHAGRRLPIKRFMSAAVTLIILLSIAFAGNAMQSLQESGLINATSVVNVIPRLPRPLADFTGIHPTVETLTAQALLAAVYIFGAIGLWWTQRRRKQGPAIVNLPGKLQDHKVT